MSVDVVLAFIVRFVANRTRMIQKRRGTGIGAKITDTADGATSSRSIGHRRIRRRRRMAPGGSRNRCRSLFIHRITGFRCGRMTIIVTQQSGRDQ